MYARSTGLARTHPKGLLMKPVRMKDIARDLGVSVITVSGYFQLFAEPYVMTRGNPLQSTVSVLYFMYEEGFTWWSLGRASAIAFLLFALILAATLLLLRWDRRGETA